MNINLILQYLLPKHILSRLVAKIANCRTPFIKNFIILWYCKFYQLDLAEAVETNYLNYPTFNDFFVRALKPDTRPMPEDPKAIASPVDGKIWQMGKINKTTLINAKEHDFTIEHLLADNNEASQFQNGDFAVLYLAPYNYHRIHMPIDGKLRSMRYVPGNLFSVNPKIADQIPDLFAKNERVVTIFDTELGPMAMILVGAMIVGSIETTWEGVITPDKHKQPLTWNYDTLDIVFSRGEEIARFKLGSTVILLFPEQTIQWQKELQAGIPIKMGQSLGII